VGAGTAAAFTAGAQPLGPNGDPTLVAHLQAQAVAGVAANHGRLAAAARTALVGLAPAAAPPPASALLGHAVY
jgi:hypothetical protein